MIYAIADLHLDATKDKDMNIFGPNWDDYENRIFSNWKKIVRDEDLVLIPGDISWAMKVENAVSDLKRIEKLPGRKILLKGNHDYWWSSLNKLNSLGFKTIQFLQNNSFVYKGIRIVGTRGWISRDTNNFNENDEKILNRELERLKLSINHKPEENFFKTIAMMHYPPFNKDMKPNEFENLFKQYGIKIVLYGHIHGPAAFTMPEGEINGIRYYCLSADKLNFIPKEIECGV